ncbi:hypothetical protein CJJ07_000459 [Candidozyma auris]|nr:hypothetical protein CJJ07_000459 [[Candida] auris]QEL62150.1 hypothetical protein CJJ09_004318 [[Candida] auris]
MFGRRRTRNSVAYTGVGYSASNHHPDNSAMAAALTIGKKSPNQHPQKPPPVAHSGSLLKRSPSLQSNSIHSSQHVRRGSSSSDRHSFTPRVEYSIDDSFTDSQLEEMGREADAHYSNRAQLRDLKLSHSPPQPEVKMVKKYVPTPNGIKVVEVPETTMKQAIARSNSMRTGLSISRSGSMTGSRNNSLSRAAGGSRSGSLTGAPSRRVANKRSSLAVSKIDESAELEQTDTNGDVSAADLRRQIEEEKQLAIKLEKQREEFEQLKQLRLQNERQRAELQRLQEEEETYSRSPSRQASPLPEESATPSIGANINAPHPVKPIGALAESTPLDEEPPQAQSTDDEEVPIQPVPFAVDEFEQKKVGKATEQIPTREDEDVTSTYSLDGESMTHAVTADDANADEVIQSYASMEPPSIKPQEDEFGIVEVPNESNSPTLAQQMKSKLQESKDDALRLPATDGDSASISESATPKFDPKPEIIDDELRPDTFAHPPGGIAASIKSGSSSDSRPIKSAMKNSKSSYSMNNNSNANVSPAQQAYISLTTAENTRLNSKLSSGQLAGNDNLSPQNHHPGPPRSPVNAQKFAATTLRKSAQAPQQHQGGLSERSLRPRTFSDASNRQYTGGGMSNRTFKTNQPQGLPPHPYTGPNYQSPAKVKAAELFAKANNRPASVLQPLKRESSFSKGSDGTKPENGTSHQPPQKNGNHRFTLRSESIQQGDIGAAAANTAHTNVQSQANQKASHAPSSSISQSDHSQQHAGGFKGFRSRFADSDDEDTSRSGSGGGFRSRFRDSEDHSASAQQASAQETPVTTLREPKVDPAAERKQKKPKKKFLKKLFGRN